MAGPSPRDLGPALSPFNSSLLQGSLTILPPSPSSSPNDPSNTGMMTLKFQYNPETVTRTRTGVWESKDKKAQEPPSTIARQNAMRGAGLYAKSETISFKLIFDATELILKNDANAAQGILPELGVLELMSIGSEQKPDDKQSASQAKPLDQVHPSELLLVLGSRRFPVVVTSMTIVEQRFNPDLTPIRAEIDMKFRVLEGTEIKGNSGIANAFQRLLDQRIQNAALADYPSDISNALDPLNSGGK